jgi:hypothetical protein
LADSTFDSTSIRDGSSAADARLKGQALAAMTEDWNGRAVETARSQGGALLLADFSNNLLRAPGRSLAIACDRPEAIREPTGRPLPLLGG